MTEAHTAELLASALDYLRRGWSVLPIGPDKRPALSSWRRYQTERPSETTIAKWFAAGALGGRVRGVGIVLGEVSGGLAVRDFDEAGAYAQWAAGHPELARTLPTVETSRGRHVYFRCPEARTLKLPGGELRAVGAYVLAPPSLHPSGCQYRWTVGLPDGPLPSIDASDFLDKNESGKSEALPPLWLEHLEHPVRLERLGPLARLVRHDDPETFVAEAIAQTVPAGVGGRNDGIFKFARRLKAHPTFAEKPASELRGVARKWFDAARPTIGTTDFDTTWADFAHAWDRVRLAHGLALADAIRTAEAADDPPCAARYDAPQTKLLIRLCRELQARAGDRPFFLAGDRAAEAVGLDPRAANRRLAMLVADNVLELVTRGHTGKASEYYYRGR